MIGTESDDRSFQIANENVVKNNLQDLIEVKKNTTDNTMEFLFADDKYKILQFCMCNPPFYTNFEELCESRSPARPPPKNAFTGSPQELITEGGEMEFCRKMIEESKKLKDKILIFTTMLGQKYSLKVLLLDLKAEGIKHTSTEFCQGRVTRWGLAWTYQNYDLSKLVPFREKARKKTIPITFVVPEADTASNTMEKVFEKLSRFLNDLNITKNVLTKRKNEICFEMTAFTNTWSNQRRKRRLQKKLESPDSKRAKIEETSNLEIDTTETSEELVQQRSQTSESLRLEVKEESLFEKNPLCHAMVRLVLRDNKYCINMEYISGDAGKDGPHQIVQYIKNNWK
ncbi:RNA N6-adenosine-methyltransferase METTL16 isoform X2 [Leptidea sinapis]|nr:RNA N6-adenosine-methyltransferase METTL16 isoform X2 [Leptidea sinapis]